MNQPVEVINNLADILERELEALSIEKSEPFEMNNPQELTPIKGYFAFQLQSSGQQEYSIYLPEKELDLPEAVIGNEVSQVVRYDSLMQVMRDITAEIKKRGFQPNLIEVPLKDNACQTVLYIGPEFDKLVNGTWSWMTDRDWRIGLQPFFRHPENRYC